MEAAHSQVGKQPCWAVEQRLYLNKLSAAGKVFVCADVDAWEAQHRWCDIAEKIDALAIAAQDNPNRAVVADVIAACETAKVAERRKKVSDGDGPVPVLEDIPCLRRTI